MSKMHQNSVEENGELQKQIPAENATDEVQDVNETFGDKPDVLDEEEDLGGDASSIMHTENTLTCANAIDITASVMGDAICFEDEVSLADLKAQLANELNPVIDEVIERLNISIPGFSTPPHAKVKARFDKADDDKQLLKVTGLLERCYEEALVNPDKSDTTNQLRRVLVGLKMPLAVRLLDDLLLRALADVTEAEIAKADSLRPSERRKTRNIQFVRPHGEVYSKASVFLVDNLVADRRLLDELCRRQVLVESVVFDILSQRNRHRRVEYLVNYLNQLGAQGLVEFVHSLRATGQVAIANTMEMRRGPARIGH